MFGKSRPNKDLTRKINQSLPRFDQLPDSIESAVKMIEKFAHPQETDKLPNAVTIVALCQIVKDQEKRIAVLEADVEERKAAQVSAIKRLLEIWDQKPGGEA